MSLQKLNIYLFWLSLTLLHSCKDDVAKVEISTPIDSLPTETAVDIIIDYNDSSLLKARIASPLMNNYLNREIPYLEMPNGVKMEFFDDSLNVMSTLTANYAIRYEREKKMEARNKVVVINKKGDMLETERLVWDENTSSFYSDKHVKITTGEEIIEGDGLEANEDFTRYKIKKVTGIFAVQK
ncbi:MAG: LPS export ABC transporter periplasmic protein LptC [Bacteroidetes bacterium]|nr:LPS export ABC transporter periplasmic protein LptC [Bacteroidota bacterium]